MYIYIYVCMYVYMYTFLASMSETSAHAAQVLADNRNPLAARFLLVTRRTSLINKKNSTQITRNKEVARALESTSHRSSKPCEEAQYQEQNCSFLVGDMSDLPNIKITFRNFWVVSRMNESSHMNEWCHVWMSDVAYEWVMSHMKESCHTYKWVISHVWMSDITYEWVMPHMNGSMSHITYEWVVSHMIKSCHIWMSHSTCEWVMPHVNESCHI